MELLSAQIFWTIFHSFRYDIHVVWIYFISVFWNVCAKIVYFQWIFFYLNTKYFLWDRFFPMEFSFHLMGHFVLSCVRYFQDISGFKMWNRGVLYLTETSQSRRKFKTMRLFSKKNTKKLAQIIIWYFAIYWALISLLWFFFIRDFIYVSAHVHFSWSFYLGLITTFRSTLEILFTKRIVFFLKKKIIIEQVKENATFFLDFDRF